MNRLDHLKQKEEPLFIPFITAGDPTFEATVELSLMLEDLGADALELGIPFSDPLADGPVIQRASARALAGGMTLKKALELAKTLRERGLQIPVIIFTYYNLLIQLGEQRFIDCAIDADVDGLLVPDLPFEESDDLRQLLKANQLASIQLVTPTTSNERLTKIGNESEGFLYCISSLGVTGVRRTFNPEVFHFLKRVRARTTVPLAVGFGVSSKAQMDQLRNECDGVVIGSAIVAEIEKHNDKLADSTTRNSAVQTIRHELETKFFAGEGVSGSRETTIKNNHALSTGEKH